MNQATNNGRNVLKQVIFGIVVTFAIAASAIVFLSLRLPRANPPELQTLTCLEALAQSVQEFENEYKKLPDVSLLDFETEGQEAVKLLTILLGKEQGTQISKQNPRQIAFLATRLTKNRRQGGLVYSSANQIEGIYDAWGNPLRLILHPPGQSTLTVPHLGKQMTTSKPAVVLSRGPDLKWGTEDDIISRTDGP
ncbi:MAG TPA: hypothetical protein VGE67_16620 [Haloferula sp.]